MGVVFPNLAKLWRTLNHAHNICWLNEPHFILMPLWDRCSYLVHFKGEETSSKRILGKWLPKIIWPVSDKIGFQQRRSDSRVCTLSPLPSVPRGYVLSTYKCQFSLLLLHIYKIELIIVSTLWFVVWNFKQNFNLRSLVQYLQCCKYIMNPISSSKGILVDCIRMHLAASDRKPDSNGWNKKEIYFLIWKQVLREVLRAVKSVIGWVIW